MIRRDVLPPLAVCWTLAASSWSCGTSTPSSLPGASRHKPASQQALPATPAPNFGAKLGAREDGSLSCVRQVLPGDDAPSPWTVALEQKLTERLKELTHCTAALPATEKLSLTARLVFDPDGSAVSQHIVQASEASCSAAECLLTGLGQVSAPPAKNVNVASYDFQISMKPGAAPLWTGKSVEPLVDDTAPASCVSQSVLQLSRAKVHAIIATTFPELKKCHSKAIERNHSAAGLVTFEFVIGLDGKVAYAEPRDSTLYDCEALQCMVSQLEPLQFARPIGRAIPVVYPIEFSIEQAPVRLR